MEKIIRFGVSLPAELLKHFDRESGRRRYANRSEAIRDLMRDWLVRRAWSDSRSEVVGTVTLVYDHHRRELVGELTEIQHGAHRMIISSQHIHLDDDNCLEVVIIRGRAGAVRQLGERLRSVRGVKVGELVMASTGAGLD